MQDPRRPAGLHPQRGSWAQGSRGKRSPAAKSWRRLGAAERGTGIPGRACVVRSLTVTDPEDEGSRYLGCQVSAHGSAQTPLKPHTLPDLPKSHSKSSRLQGKQKRSAGDHTLQTSRRGGEG